MEVLEAADGAAGLEVARREQPDIVLLDVMMPDVGRLESRAAAGGRRGDGIDPDRLPDRRAPSTPTGRRARELGGVAYLVKPFDPTVLAGVVEDVLDRLDRGEREQLSREITDRRRA
jgi:twitching motility two-component system response regulator PilH